MTKVGRLFNSCLLLLWSGIRRLRRAARSCCWWGRRAGTNNQVAIDEGRLNSHPTTVEEDKEEGRHGKNSTEKEIMLPPMVSIVLVVLYVLSGAGMYTAWETDWNYLDAVYFVCVSLSTVGFGDIVPTHSQFFLLTTLYLLIGLALVAMVINVLVERFTLTLQRVHHRVTHVHLPGNWKKQIRRGRAGNVVMKLTQTEEEEDEDVEEDEVEMKIEWQRRADGRRASM